jgi:2-iminoacetate synthase
VFSQLFQEKDIERAVHISLMAKRSDVETVLSKSKLSLNDLNILLSPAAEHYLEDMAKKAQIITRQRFGNTMQLFIPLYLSNECFNTCTYCGFSMEHNYNRVTLNPDEIDKEVQILAKKGFQHLLLLTGESPKKVDAQYIANAVRQIKKQVASVGIEVQPLSKDDYKLVFDAGADSLTLYQETYHLETYKKVHLFGLKRNYHNRLDAVERAAELGVYKLNLGALLGLYDWRFDCLALASHLNYMQKKYWKSKYSVSFPRLKDMIGTFNSIYPVNDKTFLQIILAFRLVFHDAGITLSTREPAALRDGLIPLGITQLSAESSTSPGGYSHLDAQEQFAISDHRSVEMICDVLKRNNLEPVFKDWDHAIA